MSTPTGAMGRDSFPYDAQLFNRLIVDDTDLRAPLP
jgi:hypothetical protein